MEQKYATKTETVMIVKSVQQTTSPKIAQCFVRKLPTIHVIRKPVKLCVKAIDQVQIAQPVIYIIMDINAKPTVTTEILVLLLVIMRQVIKYAELGGMVGIAQFTVNLKMDVLIVLKTEIEYAWGTLLGIATHVNQTFTVMTAKHFVLKSLNKAHAVRMELSHALTTS